MVWKAPWAFVFLCKYALGWGGVCLVGVSVLYGEHMLTWSVVRNVLAIWEHMPENSPGGPGQVTFLLTDSSASWTRTL